MDSTPSTPGGASEGREPSQPPPLPDSAEPSTGDTGAAPASATDPGATLAGAISSDEPAPAAGAHDGAPRRRRRRRRRKPLENSGSGEASAAVEAPSDASAPAASAGDGEAIAAGGSDLEAAPDGSAPQRPILRLRVRRRRHRRPHGPGLLPGPADAVPADGTASGEAAPGEAGVGPAGTEARRGTVPGQRSFHAPRRRLRHTPLSVAPAPGEAEGTPGAGGPAVLGEAGAAPGQTAPGGEPGTRPPRSRSRRRRRPPAADAAAANTGERSPEAGAPGRTGAPSAPRNRRGEPRPQGERNAGAPQGAPREGASRDGTPRQTRRDDRRDGAPRANPRASPHERDRRDRPPGRGRDAPPHRVERQLYSIDSVVDRGFEDVEEEAGTRRVNWTIVKRTTADQVSRKPVSAAYVVQRDGVDSEFPNLGAARGAVNKTIVHPEKLTRSKAEYAAEKK